MDRDDETSTTTQEERVRAHCTAHGLDLIDVIVEPGRSAYGATRSTRPGFARAKELIASGAADIAGRLEARPGRPQRQGHPHPGR